MDTVCDLFHRCVARRHDDDWYEFTQRYGPYLRHLVCQPLVRFNVELGSDDVEELVQELYLRLLAQGGSFRGQSPPELWHYLSRTAHNLVIDHWRALQRQRPVPKERSFRRARCLADPEPSPERRAMARQRLCLFLERCRWAAAGFQVELKLRIMRLAFVDGCSSQEIARELPGTVTPRQIDSMIFRLRQRLARRGMEVPRRSRQHPLPELAMAAPVTRTPLSIDR